MEQETRQHPRWYYVIGAALISGLIIEAVLFILELTSLREASHKVLDEAWRGLRELKPWNLAASYLNFIASHPLPQNVGGAIFFYPVTQLFIFPFYLISKETWPAAFVDVIQLAVGAFPAGIIYTAMRPITGGWLERAMKSMLFVILTFIFTTLSSLVVLGIIAVVAKIISVVVPEQHAVALTYSSLVGGCLGFISQKSSESILHEWVVRVIARK